MTKFYAILTNQGAARLANATALGAQLKLTQMAVGDGNGVVPTPDAGQTKLINQQRIAPLNQLSIDPSNPSQIIAEQVIPEDEGGFWIRELGLFDADGVLIAVANCPESYKPKLQEGSGRTQTIRLILIVSSTAAITLKIDPSVVLATRQYVDDHALKVKENLNDLPDKKAARGNLGLKSAATYEAGKKSGQLMPVGAFGLGVVTGEVITGQETDLPTGFYVGMATDLGMTSVRGALAVMQLGSFGGWRGQLALSDDTSRLYYRTQRDGKFTDWRDVFSTANLPSPKVLGALTVALNLSDIPDAGEARRNLGLKSAATYEVGEKASQVMAVGAFGLGVVTPKEIKGSETDLATGFYLAQAKSAGLANVAGGVAIIQLGSYGGWRGQLAMSDNSGRLYYRTQTSGIYTDWQETMTRKDAPIGVVLLWSGASPPEGWMRCNGSAFDKSWYPQLARAFPSSSVPDLRSTEPSGLIYIVRAA